MLIWVCYSVEIGSSTKRLKTINLPVVNLYCPIMVNEKLSISVSGIIADIYNIEDDEGWVDNPTMECCGATEGIECICFSF